jgi:hypothetical protein
MPDFKTDYTHLGPVIDKEGSMEQCFDNLEKLLVQIYSAEPKEKSSTKFLVIQSKVDYGKCDDLPVRVQTEVIRTLGYLKRDYNSWNISYGKFDLERSRDRQDSLRSQSMRPLTDRY